MPAEFLARHGLEVEDVERLARRGDERGLLRLLLNQLERALPFTWSSVEHARQPREINAAKGEERAAGDVAKKLSTGRRRVRMSRHGRGRRGRANVDVAVARG